MEMQDDVQFAICQNIEFGLSREYELHPQLTDSLCIMALDNAKIAIKQSFGFAKNEIVSVPPVAQGIINWCVALGQDHIGEANDLSLKEYLAILEKIKRSVQRHSAYGSRGYYEFIQQFV